MNSITNPERFLELYDKLIHAQEKSEERLNQLRLSNLERLTKQWEDLVDVVGKKRIETEDKVNSQMLASGKATGSQLATLYKKLDDEKIKSALKQLDQQEKNELAKVKKGDTRERKRIKERYDNLRKQELGLDKDIQKIYDERQKLIEKQEQANFKNAKKRYEELRKSGMSATEAKETLRAEGVEDPDTVAKIANREKTVKAFSNFAKQLEGTVKEIAYSQTAIDTRLYGSNNEKLGGSYWKQLSWNIGSNVAISPFVKQADVVDNLKTLVGKGIAYNVEQRAFLDTISDKIATTFEATDATLLKLVRIQQADSTAARLGMEAALNQFLNSMYETTEYMTEAAASIRANIYEASALMGAAEATAFEYQVQKWMGSLYSAGFNNTSGLSGALGKLAAGDISAVTDGGYGNLLVMAANKANLSIAEILAEGLDDTETNQLMQAMVSYLGQIYDETKNSKVVAQQFANVYGLTASDLKAAANLAKSTGAISKSNLGYGNFMNQLNSMANSMWSRTSMGEMMENIWGNFQYGLAEGMANDPVLYTLYNTASILSDVTGGIDFSIPMYMGTGTAQTFNIADMMRVGALGGSMLAGVGKLLSGLSSVGGFSGSGMLKAFGVGNGLNTISYGTGTGFETITSGASTSNSGYVGNTEGSDVQNKTMQDAKDDTNEQLAVAKDEDEETKLSTVDEHIVQIYQLLTDVVDGVAPFRVKIEGDYIFN